MSSNKQTVPRSANMMHSNSIHARRDFLYSLGASIGAIALNQTLQAVSSPLKDNRPVAHHISKAKRCIFLTMEGGPSHIDTFDPKPELNRIHLQKFVRKGLDKSAMESGTRYYVRSPFEFSKVGQSGVDMATNWKHLATVADDLCFYRGCQVDSVNHPSALYQLNTGNRFPGDPSLGSWATYGLGSINENLPSFVVLPESSHPQGGSGNWNNGFLPPNYQGTPMRPQGSPIAYLSPREGATQDYRAKQFGFMNQLNTIHEKKFSQHPDLAARIAQFEQAFQMQMEIPEILDLSAENQATLSEYGYNQPMTHKMARKCLLARKLVESGVRFVQLYAGTWDSHDYIKKAHGALVQSVDQPIAALIKDLKRRGLLDETLIVWAGEFGRTPDNGIRGGTAYGRDHNPKAMTVWLAGGGVKAGHIVGATDDIGANAVEEIHHIRDLHVSLLHLLGLDDNALTYFHAGRFKQLSQFGGQLIEPLFS